MCLQSTTASFVQSKAQSAQDLEALMPGCEPAGSIYIPTASQHHPACMLCSLRPQQQLLTMIGALDVPRSRHPALAERSCTVGAPAAFTMGFTCGPYTLHVCLPRLGEGQDKACEDVNLLNNPAPPIYACPASSTAD